MTSRRLLILGIAAIVAIAAGVWLAGRQGSSGSTTEAAALYPQLKEQLNSVSAVRIYKAGDARVVELHAPGRDLDGERTRQLSSRRQQGAQAPHRHRRREGVRGEDFEPRVVRHARRRGHQGERRHEPAHRAGRHTEAGESHRRQARRRSALDLRAPRRRTAELADQRDRRYVRDARSLAAQGHHRCLCRPHPVGDGGD